MKTFRVQARVAAFVGAIVLLLQISPAQAQTYSYAFQFGSYGSGDGQLNIPYGVALDAAGNIYVADSGNQRVQVFNSQGNFLFKFASPAFDPPIGVALDASGNIFVTDYYCSQGCVQVFDSQGTFLTAFGSYGRGDGQCDGPWGVAVGATGNIYVADDGNSRIEVFAPGP